MKPLAPKKTTKTPMNPKKFFKLLERKQISMGFLFLYLFLSISLLVAGFLAFVYLFYLRTLPPIESLETMSLPQSSIIRDRDGNELYSMYAGNDGKRTYVSYADISPNIVNAIVSTEDKTFFENQGIDFRGLIRSGFNYVTGKTDRLQATSTISQQLIKNAFLSNERSLERKIKEGYLSYRMNDTYSKEKILELYLNRISFGNNASGIEEAAKTYFGKSAKEVGMLGSTILASIPKWPSYYSPYTNRDRLMGYLYVYRDGKTDEKITLESLDRMKDYRPLVDAFKRAVGSLQIERINEEDAKICGLDQKKLKSKHSIDAGGCERIAYRDVLPLLNDIKISSDLLSLTGAVAENLEGYSIEYETGRKDIVASRMLEDGKMEGKDFTDVVVNGLEFQFQRNKQNIKHAHFVMYVQDYLTSKYGKDFLEQGGLQIYTSLDPKLQDKAEELVAKQVKINRDKYGATSAALVSVDNKTGQIVSMVGGPDFFNDEEQGKVNMITRNRQPGSSFKPIVYSLALSKDAISPDTPLFDVDTTFGKWNPDNYDQKFMGKMKVKTALDYSRNIPAIKMFAVAGGEESVVKHAKNLGINSLKEDGSYGMPLAIGTGEVKPIEMAQAYSVFANGGWRKELNPIMKIVDAKGNVLEEYHDTNGKYVFSDAASYLLSVILSDASSRPSSFWNNVLTLKDRPVAAKTGTSNKDVSVGEKKKILPRDLWTAGYTPQYTTVVWAGNVDGTETKGNCDGLNCAAPIWHDFMEFAHKGLPVVPFKKPDSVYTATISTISGKLASESTPDSMRVTSIFAVKPVKYETASSKEIEVDSLCNGKVTDATPSAAIKRGYLMDVQPIIESYDQEWLTAVRRWTASEAGLAYFNGEGSSNIITSYSDTICERPDASSSLVKVSANVSDGSKRRLGAGAFMVNFSGTNPIVKIRLMRDGELFKEVAVESKQEGSVNVTDLNFDTAFVGEHAITLQAVDKYGYSGQVTARVQFVGELSEAENSGSMLPSVETSTPGEFKIVLDNPTSGSVKIYEEQYFNLKAHFDGASEISSIDLFMDGEPYKTLGGLSSINAPINDGAQGLDVGMHSLLIQAKTASGAKASVTVGVEILKR